MTDIPKIRRLIKDFNFEGMFEELGWDRFRRELPVVVDEREYKLNGVREKKGVQVFHYLVPVADEFPSAATMTKIQRAVAKTAHENIVIFSNESKTRQSFRIARREEGKLLRSTGLDFHQGHSGEALAGRLSKLAISLDEEDELTLVDVTNRTSELYAERVTKKFFTKFQQQRDAFKDFIKGIKDIQQQEWYASLMLNRLMFVYFVQKKGFLDHDRDYLKTRLAQSRKANKDFHSFYQYFLLRLFHDGLNKRVADRDPDLETLLGQVPYLNGGIFGEHQIEQNNKKIKIADEAFEKLFAFFDEYTWHLDDRPLRGDTEINPDVLGYIFEKYINQKQMGAYYTKEDITEYISKNTILPYLFDEAARRNTEPFRPEREVWQLLRDDPDRYIYDAVGHGVFTDIHAHDELDSPVTLPANIAAGIADVAKRTDWNTAAPPEVALPTETWREHIARRERCLELRKKLAAGEITSINELITLNLDIRRFGQDVIDGCESPDLLSAIYTTIAGRPAKLGSNATPLLPMSVLDPTCGSGAFLFAALNILEPLYAGCLDKMEEMVVAAEETGTGKLTKRLKEFKEILVDAASHPNRQYFILKSIIINNLFGVDIMPEAVEVCKLRLFLKLMSTVEPQYDLENLGVEALPDIDFNIRAGNTLVGYATLSEIKDSFQRRFGLFDSIELKNLEKQVKIVSLNFEMFRRQQTELNGQVKENDKITLRQELCTLTEELNEFLAGDYGIDSKKQKKFADWRKSHQPFHWFAEFYGIMSSGGFNAIIGNPPWKEYSAVKKWYTVRGYSTERCGNLHGICTERALALKSRNGQASFIVQLPVVCSTRMASVRSALRSKSESLNVITFDDRPSKLFDGLQHCRSTIWISAGDRSAGTSHLASTRYQRWNSDARINLFEKLEFAADVSGTIFPELIPKYDQSLHAKVFEVIKGKSKRSIADTMSLSGRKHFCFYQEASQYWIKAVYGLPHYAKNGGRACGHESASISGSDGCA